MHNTAPIDEVVNILKILGDKTRLKIMLLIDSKEMCVCDMADTLKASQPDISQHLRRLRVSGLINENRKGKWSYYRVNRDSPMYFMVKEVLSNVNSMDLIESHANANRGGGCC